MPYPHTLHRFTEPGFFAEPPVEWTRRLREVAPDFPDLDTLVFRRMDPTNPDGSDRGWKFDAKPQWTLYSAKPVRLIEPERAEQFATHWSELPTGQQEGRKAVVSDYQHFMWHARGLYVRPFLILQGEWGGTPAKYTPTETAWLKSSGFLDEPFPIGCFPACPFDERVVKQITARDRLLKYANRYDALVAADSPLALRHEDESALQLQRATFLKTWSEIMQPSVEFAKSFFRTKEADRILPRAPEGTSDAVAQWRDHYVEHGVILNAKRPRHRAVQVAT